MKYTNSQILKAVRQAEPDPSKITKWKIFFSVPPILKRVFLVFTDPLPSFQMPGFPTLPPTHSSLFHTHPQPNQHFSR